MLSKPSRKTQAKNPSCLFLNKLYDVEIQGSQTMPRFYFDYCATTPVDPTVCKTMEPYYFNDFGNSSSMQHEWGQRANSAAQKARGQVANLLGCDPTEVIFTSGATESNNWVIRSVVDSLILNQQIKNSHFLTAKTEHKSVLNPIFWATKHGINVEYLPVNEFAQIDPQELEKCIKPNTKLVSLMWVNNEVGGINAIEKIAHICKEAGVLFHCDATQAVGKIPINFKNLGIDFLSLSGHKIYAPKGIGALIVSNERKVQLDPLFLGGGQEFSLRSGTVNIPGAVGLGAACEILTQKMHEEVDNLFLLRESLFNILKKYFPKLQRNSPTSGGLANLLHISFPDMNSFRKFVNLFPHLATSAGSACSSGKPNSHVLNELGISSELQERSIRLSLGRFTNLTEIREIERILESKSLINMGYK